MKQRSYFYCGWTTTLNIVLNFLTNLKYLWLEGRVKDGIFHNWAHRYEYRPQEYAKPTTEHEIIELIRNSPSVRLFGAGHSFNSGVVSDYALISLDDYTGILKEDAANKRLTVRAGTRVRDVIQLLLDRGWAFASLPSHNAQSIGGILSTDVHGTGRDWGWVSQLVSGIKLIDGKGDIHDLTPADELFTAAIGGIGAIGVITEVTVEARGKFNVEQKCVMDDLDKVEAGLDQLLAANEHMSLYVFPFSTRCQINTWNESPDPQSSLGRWREFFNISMDAFVSAWFGNLMAYTGVLPKLSKYVYWFKQGTDLVLESAEAYSRTIYHTHQELEFTVAYENAIPMCRKLIKTFENMYAANPKKLPYSFVEVRFTPAGHELSMIGPGRDRQCAWMDIICNDTHGFEDYYAEAEIILQQNDGRPHLGKYNETIGKDYMAQAYGQHFTRFLELRDIHDPDRKFINPFTRRVFGD